MIVKQTAGTLEKYFVDKTYDGWGIFYNEPNAPETGRACIGGSADEHIARLRCQILNSHIADVLDAVGFAKTQERLTGRCLCVGAWKSGCPVHDNSLATAGTAREFRDVQCFQENQLGIIPDGTPVPTCDKCGSYMEPQAFLGHVYRWRCLSCHPIGRVQIWQR